MSSYPLRCRRRFLWVAFDFGGTLAHSRPSFAGFIARHVHQCGRNCALHDVEKAICRVQAEPWTKDVRHDNDEEDRVFWSRFYEQTSLALGIPASEMHHVAAAMVREHYARDSFCLYPDVLPAFERIARTRCLSIAVASNFDSSLRARLDLLGLSPFVQQAIVSAEIGVSKPAQEFYVRLLDQLEATPEHVLWVGNSVQDDLEPGVSMGIPSVLIDRQGTGVPDSGRIATLEELDLA